LPTHFLSPEIEPAQSLGNSTISQKPPPVSVENESNNASSIRSFTHRGLPSVPGSCGSGSDAAFRELVSHYSFSTLTGGGFCEIVEFPKD
jgi:hypothetical protein